MLSAQNLMEISVPLTHDGCSRRGNGASPSAQIQFLSSWDDRKEPSSAEWNCQCRSGARSVELVMDLRDPAAVCR